MDIENVVENTDIEFVGNEDAVETALATIFPGGEERMKDESNAELGVLVDMFEGSIRRKGQPAVIITMDGDQMVWEDPTTAEAVIMGPEQFTSFIIRAINMADEDDGLEVELAQLRCQQLDADEYFIARTKDRRSLELLLDVIQGPSQIRVEQLDMEQEIELLAATVEIKEMMANVTLDMGHIVIESKKTFGENDSYRKTLFVDQNSFLLLVETYSGGDEANKKSPKKRSKRDYPDMLSVIKMLEAEIVGGATLEILPNIKAAVSGAETLSVLATVDGNQKAYTELKVMVREIKKHLIDQFDENTKDSKVKLEELALQAEAAIERINSTRGALLKAPEPVVISDEDDGKEPQQEPLPQVKAGSPPKKAPVKKAPAKPAAKE